MCLSLCQYHIVLFTIVLQKGFFFLVYFRAAPAAYGSSQGMGQIGAMAMPDPQRTKQGQGLNLHLHVYLSGLLPLSHNGTPVISF